MISRTLIVYPVALALSIVNLVGTGFAVGTAQPAHAAAHALLAMGFGYWAQRVRRGSTPEPDASLDANARLEELESELGSVRAELSEAQERLDFVERLLAREPEPQRLRPDR